LTYTETVFDLGILCVRYEATVMYVTHARLCCWYNLYGVLSQDIQETFMDWFRYRHLAIFGFFTKAIGYFTF